MNIIIPIIFFNLLSLIDGLYSYPIFKTRKEFPTNILSSIEDRNPPQEKIDIHHMISIITSDLIEDQSFIIRLNYNQDHIENLPEGIRKLVFDSIRLMQIYRSDIQRTYNHFLNILYYIINKNYRNQSIMNDIIEVSAVIDRIIIKLEYEQLSVNLIKDFIYNILDVDMYFNRLLVNDKNYDNVFLLD